MEGQPQLGEQAAHHRVESLAAGQCRDGGVETYVGCAHRGPVAAAGCRATGGHRGAHVVDRAAQAGPLEGAALDDPSGAIDVGDVGGGQSAYEDTAVWHVHQEPLGDQHLEGLAQRVARDLEQLGELLLRQLGVGRQRPDQHPFA
jgi:hypothetical protein